jgi:hypothetical protein
MSFKQVIVEPDKNMKIRIKDLNTSAMEITDKGIELEFRDTEGKHVGDLIIRPATLTWNKGQTSRHGKSTNWPRFFRTMSGLGNGRTP